MNDEVELIDENKPEGEMIADENADMNEMPGEDIICEEDQDVVRFS